MVSQIIAFPVVDTLNADVQMLMQAKQFLDLIQANFGTPDPADLARITSLLNTIIALSSSIGAEANQLLNGLQPPP